MSLHESVSRIFQRRKPHQKRFQLGSGSGPRPLRQRLGIEPLEDRCLLDGSWATVAPMPAARSSAAAAAVDNTVYVAGGSNGHETATLQAYNTLTDGWATLKDMPSGRYGGDGAAVINGKVYVPGGWDNSYSYLPHSELFIYDPAGNTWTSGANMPLLSGCGASGAINGKLYVTTPCNGYNGYYTYLHVYDPVSNSWAQLASSAYAHSSPAAGVINGKFYVAGGYDNSGQLFNVLEVYDPEMNKWATKTHMPIAVGAAAGAVLNGKLYVVGGWDGTQYHATAQVYDPVNDTWTMDTPMPTARNNLVAGVVNSVLYAIGGGNSTGNLKTNEAFTPSTLTATGTDIYALAGQKFAAVVASFIDSGNAGAATDYSAVVDWGDNTPISTGGISDNGGGNYDVAASHTYAGAGTFTITITITDNRDPTRVATAYSTAHVSGGVGPWAPFLLTPTASDLGRPATLPVLLTESQGGRPAQTADGTESMIPAPLAISVPLVATGPHATAFWRGGTDPLSSDALDPVSLT
jgi:N-acetylneuraminic acid mutarotase